MAKIRVRCSYCTRSVWKEEREVRRRRRQGHRKFFCNRSCAITAQLKKKPRPVLANLRPGNRKDLYTPFRWFLLRARQRPQHGSVTLSLDDLRVLWELQKGICPITGWALILPESAMGWKDGPSPRNASLDRLNHRVGYVPGNVRFVSLMANLARHMFSDDELRGFCSAVASQSTPRTSTNLKSE